MRGVKKRMYLQYMHARSINEHAVYTYLRHKGKVIQGMKIKVIYPVPALAPELAGATEKYLERSVLPGTELEFDYIEQGYLSVETAAQDIVNGAEVVKQVMKLQDEDCDGIFINCFDDPALLAAREVSKKPVLAPYSAAVSFAGLLSEKIGIITTDMYGISCEERKAREYGFTDRIAAVKPVDFTVLELKAEELTERVVSCCREFESERITAVVLGCTGMNRIAETAQEILRKEGSRVQLIEPLKTGVKMLELMIQLGFTDSIAATPVNPDDYVKRENFL